ncbi:hypothetical protein NX722_28410 [Endozoicomonas gorgoniicola]|uniref:Rho termination factor N-terminal domain-containing protein n=1 Tax=Endozoicomonas gorgoniicola TaxID=1234144 RepID=A0ABT3N4D7_9GAMM|nr:hypothetical protein [Endozoicomonas gorgoniicola]MCW7556490.1 hypothetical protein [Endozoicomonas gorgoniicola]
MSASEATKQKADELGITYPNNIGEDTLLKKIDEHLGNFSDADDSDEQQETPKTSSGSERPEKVTIILQEDENNQQPVPVGFNGKNYVIKRGVEVEVPYGVYAILKDATETHYDEDGNASQRQSYPFNVVI